MQNRGAVTVLLVFTLAFIIIVAELHSMSFAPPIPTLVYEPTLPPPDQKVVCLIFDDGWKSQLYAVPILQSLGFNATFAIVTSYNGYPAYMNWADVASLAKGAWTLPVTPILMQPSVPSITQPCMVNLQRANKHCA